LVRLGDSGFTLVEALIAMVVSGFLASAMLALVLGQSRFYERMDDQIWAEQTNRATIDLMLSELRQASTGDLIAAESDSVSIRFDIIRAVVCDSTAADEATLMAYDSIAAWGLAGGFIGTAYSDPYVEDFEYVDGWLPTTGSTGSTPKATCVANGAPGTGTDNTFATMTGWGAQFTNGVPDRGAFVRFYGRLTYRFAASTFFESRAALWRGAQELTGPFVNGAAFSYVMANGSVQNSVASGSFDQVRAIRVTATAVGDGANRYNVQRDLEFEIPFRN
jgi:prepilin-type N-terminal cleavage/methylation domain-containing protein